MSATTIVVGKRTRFPSEGLRRLSAPVECDCGKASDEVLVDRSGPHLTAYCPRCRRYVRHLKATDLEQAPRAETTVFDRDPIAPGFGIVLVRIPSGRGHREAVAGSFASLPERRRLLRSSHEFGSNDVRFSYPVAVAA